MHCYAMQQVFLCRVLSCLLDTDISVLCNCMRVTACLGVEDVCDFFACVRMLAVQTFLQQKQALVAKDIDGTIEMLLDFTIVVD